MNTDLVRTLGYSKIKVYPLAFGTWPLTGLIDRITEQKAIELLQAVITHGVNLIDTADCYCLDETEHGYGERLVAKALASYPHPEHIIVATKGGFERTKGDWINNADPAYLKKAVEASLTALNVSCIELYHLHSPSPYTPFLETIEALAQLQAKGKIKYIGLSNVSLEEIKTARSMIDVASIQNQCNPFDLSSFKTGIIDYCEKNNIAFFAYSPFGGEETSYRIATHPVLLKIANEYNATPYQITLAWLLAKSPIMIPIYASVKVNHVIDNLKAVEIHLNSTTIKELDQGFGL